MYRLPLFDHRVLDLTTTPAGAYTTRLLGDLGAEVVLLEAAERTGHADLYVNKYSAAIDVAAAEGRTAMLKLIAGSDIVVYDRPIGADYADLKAANGRIIALALPPDGNAGTAVAAAGAVGLALWDQRRTGGGSLIELRSPPAVAIAAAPEVGTFEPVSSSEGVRDVRSPHWRLSETPLHVRLPAPQRGEHDEYVQRLLG